MRRGGRLFIVLGVALALVASALAAIAFMGGGDENTSAAEKTSEVVQAARDIRAGSVLRQEDVQTVEIKESDMLPGAAVSTMQVLGQAVTNDVVTGQQLVMTELTTPGLTNTISEGMRAVAIPLDRLNSLGGMIRTDDRVDLVYSTRLNLLRVLPTNIVEVREDTTYAFDKNALGVPPVDQAPPENYPYPGEDGSRFLAKDTEDGDPVSKLILQDLRVLRVVAGDETVGATSTTNGTDDSSEDSEEETSKLPAADLMIIEVDPQQAEIIKFIQDNLGLFQVVLRGPQDHNTVNTTGISYQILIDSYALPVPKSVHMPEGGQ